MKEWYNDFCSLSRKWRMFFTVLLVATIPYKIFFILFQTTTSGPDCAEYNHLAELFRNAGIIGYIKSTDPISFWRTPMLPFVLYITHSLTVFYIVQQLFTYFLAYNFYKIFKYITKDGFFSLITFFIILYLTYINNAACATLTEFLQISLIIYVFRKALYQQYDLLFILALSVFCLLRAEAQYFCVFLILRELVKRKFSRLVFYIVPIVVMQLWCMRNDANFGSYSLVNPILGPRAVIGSLYGYIYNDHRNKFHADYNYFDGQDYIHQKPFIEEYKRVVKERIMDELKHRPLEYARIRIFQIAHSFLYFGFNLERLPDQHWSYRRDATYNEIFQSNQLWSYGNILKTHDYGRLIVRLLYNGGLGLMHLVGLLFIFYNYRKLLPLIFIFLNFSFIFVVEVDMRYLITMQAVCVCGFGLMLYSLKKYRSLKLNRL